MHFPRLRPPTRLDPRRPHRTLGSRRSNFPPKSRLLCSTHDAAVHTHHHTITMGDNGRPYAELNLKAAENAFETADGSEERAELFRFARSTVPRVSAGKGGPTR